MKKIIYNLNGNFQCASPAHDDATFLQLVLAKDVPAWATDVTVVDDSDIPSSRTFRNAWVVSHGKVTVDMVKAKDIKMTKIRIERDSLLDQTDKQWIAKTEKGNDLKDLKDKRQKLRDLPQTVVLDGMTADQLEAFDAFVGLR